jgi:hypothetical protein
LNDYKGIVLFGAICLVAIIGAMFGVGCLDRMSGLWK